MKRVWPYLLILVLLGILAYIWALTAFEKIKFKFKFRGISFESINLEDLLFQGQAVIRVLVDAEITNYNNFAITFSDVFLWFYHNNQLIAKTASNGNKNLQKVRVSGNSVTDVTEELDFYINPRTVSIAKDIRDKKHVKIDYTVKIKVFGIPYIYHGFFEF